MRRIREGDDVREHMAAQLGSERGPGGEPTLSEFLQLDVGPALARIVERFDELPLYDKYHRRLTIEDPATHLPYFHIFARLDPSDANLIVVTLVDVGRWDIAVSEE